MGDPERGGPCVLVVDPSETGRTATREALEGRGLSVRAVGSATEALDALEADGIDCVVAAQDLPDSEGTDLLRTVRVRRPDLPFVLQAADGDEHLASEAVRLGVSDYLPRPGDGPHPELGERVRSLAGHADGGVVRPQGARSISEAVKERAMDEAPVGITISDPALPDNPLIYINDAYEEVTGYDAGDVIGRNCRMLQGEDTEEEPVTEMRRKIDAEEPVTVELLNYRADGEEFWNRVSIAPIYDDEGELIHYVGFQMDITERVEAEQAAQRRADELAHLLDRVNGLMSDVTDALVRAGSRADVERAVPARVVEAGPFELSWIGRRDLAAEAVVATEWAPASAGLEGLAVPLDDDDPVARAVETGEVQVANVADTDHHADLAGGEGVVAAVPLVYRETTYGVLAAYAGDRAAVDERERVVLGALGRAVATAINAQESQRMLTADDVVELEVVVRDRSLFVVDMAAELGATLEFVGAVYPEDGDRLLFFSVEGAAAGAVEEYVAGADAPASATLLAESEGGAVFEFAVPDDPVLGLLADHGAELRELSVDAEAAELLVELSREADARAVVEALRDRYDGVDLRAFRRRERPARTRREFVAALEERLTDRQLTALRKAYVGGFFEWPHGTSGDELAESMGISRSTFHQHLRAAQRKLVEEFYER